MKTTKQKKRTITLTFTLLFAAAFMATAPLTGAVVWGSDVQLTNEPTTWEIIPSVMQTRDGTFWVVYASDMFNSQFDLLYQTSSDNGSSWSDEVRLTYHLGMDLDPSIMQTNNETIWLVWSSDRTDNQEIFYKTSFNNGFTWEPMVQLTNDSRVDTQPSIMQNLNGTIWIVWHREIEFGNYDIYFKTSSDNGLSWSDEVRLTDDPSWDIGPSITHTENGTVFVVWSSHQTGNYDLFYKTYNGSSWSIEAPITTDPDWDHNPSIIQDAGGTIWVFWESDRGGNYDIYYATSSNYGASWISDTPVITSNGDDQSPSVVFSNNRKIWVVFETTRTSSTELDFEIFYTTSDPIPDVHDTAILSLVPWTGENVNPATWAPAGMPIYINLTVENQGTFNETFNVKVYADKDTGDVHIDLGTKNVNLTNGAKTTLMFTWNTTETPHGNYYLSAETTIHPLEYDVADNTLLKAARIGGIAFPWHEPGVNVLALLAPPVLAALIVAALGMAAVVLFKLLMSVRLPRPWRRSIDTKQKLLQKRGIQLRTQSDCLSRGRISRSF